VVVVVVAFRMTRRQNPRQHGWSASRTSNFRAGRAWPVYELGEFNRPESAGPGVCPLKGHAALAYLITGVEPDAPYDLPVAAVDRQESVGSRGAPGEL
jgi:hypothetical protein